MNSYLFLMLWLLPAQLSLSSDLQNISTYFSSKEQLFIWPYSSTKIVTRKLHLEKKHIVIKSPRQSHILFRQQNICWHWLGKRRPKDWLSIFSRTNQLCIKNKIFWLDTLSLTSWKQIKKIKHICLLNKPVFLPTVNAETQEDVFNHICTQISINAKRDPLLLKPGPGLKRWQKNSDFYLSTQDWGSILVNL
ncbi:MAG: hypothetical protein ACOYOK_10900 [Pseudobdellovibrionaceae bacterium]